jgi:cell division protein FtsB
MHDSRKLHPDDATNTDLLLVDPSAIPFINMNAIKQLDLRIDGLEAKVDKIDAVDAKVQELEARVQELESQVKALQAKP